MHILLGILPNRRATKGVRRSAGKRTHSILLFISSPFAANVRPVIMSTEIKDLIRKRGVVKGRLTNFINYIEKLDTLTSLQIIELKVRLNKIDSLYDQFEEIQTAIECNVDEKDKTAHLAERTEFENLFYAHVAVAQEILNANKPAKNDNHSSSASYVSHEADEQAGVKGEHASTRGIKLPTIQIPRFSGQYDEWLEFHDLFVSLIHESTSISDIQKFHYLRASLEGAAAQVVKSLEFSARNYKIAWDLLCDRYDNKRLLVQNHIQALFALEPTKKESYQSIRKIIDTFAKNLRALDTLGEPTASWDTLIIYIMSTKLDPRTLREWEEYKSDAKTIKLKQFTSFLKNRADLLETLYMSNNSPSTSAKADKYKSAEHYKGLAAFTQTNQTHYTLNKYICPLCKQNHRIYRCDQFLGQSVNERADSVRKLKLCENCLRPGHQARVCRLGPCMKCSQRHNTTLHPDTPLQSNEAHVVGATSLSVEPTGRVLLSTALIHMYDRDNHRHEVKALLDSGSQASFMTDSLLHKLKLNHTQVQSSVVGINNTVSKITKRCNAFIESRTNSYKTYISFLILPNIATLCNNQVSVPKLNIPTQVVLADPEYFNPSSIDILLGADIFWDLLEHGQIRLGPSCPILQHTKLGYVVSGPTSGLTNSYPNSLNTIISCNLIADNTVQEQLAKFWSLEEVPDNSKLVYSTEERLCENNFVENYSRMPDGRFSVAVPLKRPESSLGDSFERAKQCFLSLERRLHKQPQLKQMYTDFMSEYIELGHMSETQFNIQADIHSFFLPHHGVLRDNSTTTKLRVVFNASAVTSSGVSYNDLQMIGPTIQSDLLSILLRFRHYSYVLTGDIEKMYRQVLIHENQRHLQQILWREDPNQDLKLYKLNTVTYGTASAPFLAVRSLKQLALECNELQISQIISDDFYVDDLVTGSQTKEQLQKIKERVCQVLSTGCFNLRKIRSNINLSQSDSCQTLNLGDQGSSNTLGLGWSPTDDQLYYSIKQIVDKNPTKRSILSAIGQIYDPLGLLSVCVIQAKIMLQKLWLLKLSWDEPLPSNIINLWHKFTSDLHYVVDLRIPRCVINDDPNSVIEIHTFCDSSQDAYGACLYVRSECNGQVDVKLLCAKSKVAPLKPTTIPRLELCGALVAARLTEKVLKSFRIPVSRCVLWTDSSIVLGWLQTQPSKLKQFVKNRVAEIQELTTNHEWRHVPTALNPADMLSRGVNVSELHELSRWWTGPDFLKNNELNWPKNNFIKNNNEIPEMIMTATVSTQINNSLIDFERFSKLLKLQRTLAYTLRFIYNCRNKNKRSGPLTTDEIHKAFILLIKSSQQQSFKEYNILLKKQSLPNKNKLLILSPFIDESELIRVGGRLENSKFMYNKKHPMLLSSKHPLTKLVFVDEHIRLMHAGPQLLLASIRDQFWPIGGRALARSVAHKCLRCFRMRAQTANPIMGHLPEQRLDPGYTFQTTGVDYAGPLLAADRKGRGCKLIKVYVVVFVCFATKCLHLELVTSLTKEAYIAALHRFISRRGKPEMIFSDNGTQFVGAKNELNAFLKQNSSSISEFMANEFIEFKFSPAYAPHFGGLWEAGVKSFKHHLTRVLGDSHLTFEELYTVLVKIEAILNSRPLSPMSSDPSDLSPLTPGHFLVRRPLTALPVPSLENINPTRLQRWHRIEQIHQHFWARWQKEYVSELQQRTKWRSCKGSLDAGTMVIIKEDAMPPLKWSLGRIINVYPGIDGVNRKSFQSNLPAAIGEHLLKARTFNAGGHVGNITKPAGDQGGETQRGEADALDFTLHLFAVRC
ncbi:hypothetical protein MSG28_009178 [Choristoneura fumiferana]|uniref:Uncharacterized protein n=1 Tax=Choristoneura fumiferana TaxID=7141 RepID=A0ACC0KWD1_CHOFU|nr:hypothetical protein MSG28_009178 [Choristoneura fumiferana]